MGGVTFTPQLAAEYKRLWETMELDPGAQPQLAAVAKRILSNKARYEAVAKRLGSVPWYFIGLTHNLEAGGRFDRHLHNGDPLSGRTVQVPKGRPLDGQPPFTWEQSAFDAILMKGLHNVTSWPIERLLYEAERYNGFGYRLYHPEDRSPYLWSKSNHNDGTGKYVRDGVYSSNAPSESQCGFAPTLRVLMGMDPSINLASGAKPSKPLASGVGGAVAGGTVAVAVTQGWPVWQQALVGIVAAAVVGLVVWLVVGRKK